VNGVWVPKRASKNDQGQQAHYKDKKIDTLKVTFEWVLNRVNEPLHKGALSLPSLGLRQGDRIVNKITGKTIIVDGPEFPSRKPVPTGRVATSSH
jgi:hypothetical protein